MARRSNKLVWLIGILLIAFGLAKGGMYWYVKQKLDKGIMEVAPRATIEYAGLDTSLKGRIDIRDISVVPVGQSEAFKISRVSIQGPDALAYLLNHNPVTGSEGPPEYLNIAINNLSLDLTGSLASNLDQDYLISMQQGGAGVAAACRGSGNMSLGMLKDMGYNTLTADGRLFYRYDEHAKELRGNIELDVFDIQSLFMELTLGNVSSQVLKSGSPGMPWLTGFRVTTEIQPEFGKKVSTYCAAKTGQTIAEYEEQAAGMFMRNLADNGIVLGRGLKMAVRSYHRDWGEIDIIAKPAEPVKLLELMLRPPQNIEQAFGLQVAINDQLLTDLDFKLQKGARLFVPDPPKKKKAAAPKPRYRMVWKKISTANLHRYLDRNVKLYMTGQPIRKGILMDVNEKSVAVEQRVDGGKFTAHVPMKNIIRAEAKIRVRTNPPSTSEKGKTK